MKKFIIGSLLAMLAINTPAYAQQVTAGRTSTGRIQTIKVGEDGTAITSTNAETLSLIVSNVPVSAKVVIGGSYTLLQSCTTYGVLTFRYLGPDGSTMLSLLTKTVSDSSGGTIIVLGNGQTVDATVSSTTGCNAKLLRNPQ